MRAAFLTKLKVTINKGFSWEMSTIFKGEGCEKRGPNIIGMRRLCPL